MTDPTGLLGLVLLLLALLGTLALDVPGVQSDRPAAPRVRAALVIVTTLLVLVAAAGTWMRLLG